MSTVLNSGKTGDEIALAELKAGRRLTSLSFWREHGYSRLAAYVHRLRKAGWPIETHEIPVECRGGRLATIAEYRLDSFPNAEAANE